MAGPFVVVSGFIVIGIACTLFARQVQRFYIRSCERWPPPFKWPRKHMESRFYVWEIRIIGIITLSVGLYHLLGLLSHL
jgi:hypothetical protein